MRADQCQYCGHWIVMDYDPMLSDYSWQDGMFFSICVVGPEARHSPRPGRLTVREEP